LKFNSYRDEPAGCMISCC